jgi:hypothetical protein
MDLSSLKGSWEHRPWQDSQVPVTTTMKQGDNGLGWAACSSLDEEQPDVEVGTHGRESEDLGSSLDFPLPSYVLWTSTFPL